MKLVGRYVNSEQRITDVTFVHTDHRPLTIRPQWSNISCRKKKKGFSTSQEHVTMVLFTAFSQVDKCKAGSQGEPLPRTGRLLCFMFCVVLGDNVDLVQIV